MSHHYSIDDLLQVMRYLRNPHQGCPWDIEQNYSSITSSTIEEAYEVVDAIEQKSTSALQEELGDLLFQIIFYCQLASEEKTEDKQFNFEQVVGQLTDKLIRRHPHVFADGQLKLHDAKSDSINTSHQVLNQWEQIKQSERNSKGLAKLFDDVPKALPALTRAEKMQKRAANIGFDWQDYRPVIGKLKEEIDELEQAIASGDAEEIGMEMGDILFTAVNLSRKLKYSSEQVLRKSNIKFQQRMEALEQLMHTKNKTFASANEAELDELWEQVKRQLNNSS